MHACVATNQRMCSAQPPARRAGAGIMTVLRLAPRARHERHGSGGTAARATALHRASAQFSSGKWVVELLDQRGDVH